MLSTHGIAGGTSTSNATTRARGGLLLDDWARAYTGIPCTRLPKRQRKRYNRVAMKWWCVPKPASTTHSHRAEQRRDCATVDDATYVCVRLSHGFACSMDPKRFARKISTCVVRALTRLRVWCRWSQQQATSDTPHGQRVITPALTTIDRALCWGWNSICRHFVAMSVNVNGHEKRTVCATSMRSLCFLIASTRRCSSCSRDSQPTCQNCHSTGTRHRQRRTFMVHRRRFMEAAALRPAALLPVGARFRLPIL